MKAQGQNRTVSRRQVQEDRPIFWFKWNPFTMYVTRKCYNLIGVRTLDHVTVNHRPVINNARVGLARAKSWLADGTFKAVPCLFFQLCSIHYELAPDLITAAVYCVVRSMQLKQWSPLLHLYRGWKNIFKCNVRHFYTVSQKTQWRYYQFIFTALKIIIYNNIVCFCLQTSEMHLKLSVI